MHGCPLRHHYDFKLAFCWFVCGTGNNFCSQVLKSGLIQSWNGAFWPHHRVCCNFMPEDKCQAWIFVLWILYIFLRNILFKGEMVLLFKAFSKEKWCYKTLFLANWNIFLLWSFSFTKAAEKKLPLTQRWLGAAKAWSWYLAGAPHCASGSKLCTISLGSEAFPSLSSCKWAPVCSGSFKGTWR